jgi:hypothetical protein
VLHGADLGPNLHDLAGGVDQETAGAIHAHAPMAAFNFWYFARSCWKLWASMVQPWVMSLGAQ